MAAAPEPQISSPAELQVWLEDKPEEWAQQIAARLALRVFPLVFEVIGSPDDPSLTTPQRSFVLQAFRAGFISWAAGKYRESEVHGTAIHAGGLVPGEWNESAAYYHAARAVAESAYATYDSLGDHEGSGKADTVDTARYAADAAETAAGAAADIWTSITEDCSWLVENEGDLIGQPLWLNDVRGDPNYAANFPPWVRRPFDTFAKSETARTTSWGLIVAWYRKILPNIMGERPRSPFDEPSDIKIATRPDEFWTDTAERSVHQIMDDIAEIAAWTSRETVSTATFNQTLKPVSIEATASVGRPHISTATEQRSDDADEGGKKEIERHVERETHAELQPDRPDPTHDYLDRSRIAFILAGRINQIWDKANEVGKESHHKDYFLSRLWTGLRSYIWYRPLDPGFVIHVDAPWGGGKTSFAGYVTRILNPYRDPDPMPDWLEKLPMGDPGFWPEKFHRPWHIVHFNAWKNQDVKPPWWVFAEAIRKSCLDASLNEKNNRNNTVIPEPVGDFAHPPLSARLAITGGVIIAEWAWRLMTPAFLKNILVATSAIFVVMLLVKIGWLNVAAGKTEFGTNASTEVAALLTLLLGGGAAIWKLFAAFGQSLLPGTPDAAKNYALGSGDPLERFRRHFARTLKAFHRPVIVVVDDIDRCDPAYVVDLIRGMQTIMVSPRIVFLLLGDRDWIERAFAQSHKEMNGIDVGPEHSFGGRFVEKAIQMSFVLPDITKETRENYVRKLLSPASKAGDADRLAELAEPVALELRQQLDLGVLKESNFRERESAATRFRKAVETSGLSKKARESLERDLNAGLALKSAGDESVEEETGHMMLGLARHLPPNPRQIKRIINSVSLLQELARIRRPEFEPGGKDWQLLVRWAVLMIEWPKTWYTLSRYPGLAELALGRQRTEDLPDKNAEKFVDEIKGNVSVMSLLRLSDAGDGWGRFELSVNTIKWLREIMPATSGSLLELPSEKKNEEDKETR